MTWVSENEWTVPMNTRPPGSTPRAASRSSSSRAHSLLYVMQAAPRGFRTSSASMRAILVVRVLVLPLPGPASTTQWPRDS